MRVGDWETIEKSSFHLEDEILRLHKRAIGENNTGGKTSNATRVLSITPTLLKLYERGYIFERTAGLKRGQRLANMLKRKRTIAPQPMNVFPHMLRHTFATNYIIVNPNSGIHLANIMGHGTVDVSADVYGGYAKESNAGKLQVRYKELIDFLENHYFDKVNPPKTKAEWDKEHQWYKEKNKIKLKKVA